MALPVQFQQLILEARMLADQRAPNNFLNNSEVGILVNRACQRLYAKIFQDWGDNYFTATQQYTTVANQDTYPLPSDFQKLLWVDLQIDANGTTAPRRITLRKLLNDERNIFNNLLPTSWLLYGLTNVRYFFDDDNIIFRPLPVPANAIILIKYVPVFQWLVNPTDTWEHGEYAEMIVTETALKMAMIDNDNDKIQSLGTLLEKLYGEMDAEVENRDGGEPMRIVDVRRTTGSPFGGAPGGWS